MAGLLKEVSELPSATTVNDEDFVHIKQGVSDKKIRFDLFIGPHANRSDNPHNVTKVQVGLSNVSNDLQLKRASNLSDVPNKATARFNLDVFSKGETNNAVNAHSSRTDNPHNVTKTQVGLSNVINAEQLVKSLNLSDIVNPALARTNLNIYSKQEVNNQHNSHANRTDNPHNVTKIQVGLSNVSNDLQLKRASNLSDLPSKSTSRDNLGVYSKTEVNSAVSSHANRTDNPHNVTKAQVGLANVDNDLQLKWKNNLSDVQSQVTARDNLNVFSRGEVETRIAAHANLSNNPHAVTKSQVGLSNVMNYGATSNYLSSSNTTYATARAVNSVYNLLAAYINSNSFVPSGAVIMWSGLNSDIPAGYALCDGTNGTPDLRDRFVVGTGGIYPRGERGGTTHTNHTHAGVVGNHTLTEDQIPAHRHYYTDDDNRASNFTRDGVLFVSKLNGGGADGGGTQCSYQTSATGGNQPHNHPFSINNQIMENRPPYYAIAFIMKL